jgi:hypothetical protein
MSADELVWLAGHSWYNWRTGFANRGEDANGSSGRQDRIVGGDRRRDGGANEGGQGLGSVLEIRGEPPGLPEPENVRSTHRPDDGAF